ncbi:MAG: hypothetical protein IPI67_34320 [Myxococcales bacterium]|nr:hypothetical protein [Myxococcales bacterium]
MARFAVRFVGALLAGSVVGLALASSTGACSAPCETADTSPVRYKQGSVSPDGTTYASSPWEGPYLHFPGGRRYQLEHGLGVTPPAVFTYLAFDERPLPNGNTAESAGNQVVIERVDDQIIQVRNDTCAEFWLRVVAMAGPSAGPADAGGD